MKFFLFLTVFIVLFISCNEETTTYKSCDPKCEEWETCNNNNGLCELNDSKCRDNDDCKDNSEKTVCDLTKHICVLEEELECTVNEDCKDDAKPVCKDNVCIAEVAPECTVNEDCKDDTKPVCKNNVCIAEEVKTCIGLSFDIKQGSTYSHFYEALTGNYFLSVGFHAETLVGDYELNSVGLNDNLKTCEQCVLIHQLDDNDETEKVFFQSEGMLHIEKGEATSGESIGNITNIKLIEVTIGEQYLSTPVENGDCIEIETNATWNWDTMPTCELNATRCSDDKTEIEKCTDSENNIWASIDECDVNKECKLNGDTPVCELKDGFCEIGTQRCNDNHHIETCSADGVTWDITDCTLPSICTENSNVFTCETNNKTILDIRTAENDLAEGENGSIYTTTGTVIAVTEHGFYMQDGTEAGIFVFLGYSETPTEMPGDNLVVTATAKNYHELLELVSPLLITISGTGDVPAFTDLDAIGFMDSGINESMLVKMLNPPFEVLIVDQHDIVLKDNNDKQFMMRNRIYTEFPDPRVGQKYLKLQGVLTNEHGFYKLLPRNASDIEEKPEIVDCPNGNECDENFINTVCDSNTHKCIVPVEIDVCSDLRTECENNTNGKTSCYEYQCIELVSTSLLNLRTAEVNLGNNEEGALYKTNGIVTAITDSGFYMQDGVEAGIFVYTGESVTQIEGDRVEVIGKAKNYQGLLEIISPEIKVLNSEAIPDFTDIDAVNILDLEVNESMLVNFLSSPFVVLFTDSNNNTTLTDINGNQFIILNLLYDYPEPVVNTVYSSLSGILTYRNGKYKLLPQNEGNMVLRPEVTDCLGGNECIVNIINTVCDISTQKCIPAVEVVNCPNGDECSNNTDGKTTCFNDICVVPVEINDCSGDNTVCEANTNGKTVCIADICSEVETCTAGGSECDTNFVNTVCNESTLKCEPAPLPPVDGSFEEWNDTNDVLTYWDGTKTSIDSYLQSVEPRTGNYAVNLINEETTHKRFSHKASVWAAGDYHCTAYAKGKGEVRIGYYGDSNFKYGSYLDLDGTNSDWSEVFYDFTIDSEISDFQLMISLRDTDATGMLIDDISCVLQ